MYTRTEVRPRWPQLSLGVIPFVLFFDWVFETLDFGRATVACVTSERISKFVRAALIFFMLHYVGKNHHEFRLFIACVCWNVLIKRGTALNHSSHLEFLHWKN